MVIKYILILIQVAFIARFHLELSKVNAMIEPINTLRKVTNPLVLPVKTLLPWMWMKKAAAIVVALLLTLIVVWVFFPQLGLVNSLITSVLFLTSTWITFLQYGMFLYVIGSWVQLPALQRANYLLYNVFQPMLKPIQRILPSFAGLDFSPIVFLLLLSFAANNFSNIVESLLN